MEKKKDIKDFKTFIKQYPANTMLIRENELSRKMYIIISGSVRVFKSYLNKKVVLAVLKENDFFGEFSFLDAAPRSASVEAVTDLKVYEVNANDVKEELENLPPWLKPIIKGILTRFRVSDEHLAVYQSRTIFEQKMFNRNSIHELIYKDIYRVVKTILLMLNDANANFEKGHFEKEFFTLIGNINLSTLAVLKQLEAYDYQHLNASTNKIEFNKEPLMEMEKFLLGKIENNSMKIYGHQVLRILQYMTMKISSMKENTPKSRISIEEIVNQENAPIETAIDELNKEGLIELKSQALDDKHTVGIIEFENKQILSVYHYQTFLKYFDHTIDLKSNG